MLGPVSQYVLTQVKNTLAAKCVLVWFDQEGEYESLLPHLEQPTCTVIAWTGSYYEMAHKAHKPFTNLSKANRAKGHTLLLYVPRPEAEATPLLEFATAGSAFSLPLRVAAQRALAGTIPQAALEEMLANQRPKLADLDRMGGGEQPSLLQAIFHTADEAEIFLRYLTSEGWEEKIDDRGALNDLVSLAQSAFGLSANAVTSSHVGLKESLWRLLLISHLREGLTPQPSALINTPQPLPEQYRRIDRTLGRIRLDADAVYATIAAQVASETGVSGWTVDPATVKGHETFAFLEKTALTLVQQLVTKEANLDASAHMTERYRTSFWVKRQENRLLQWRAAELALELCQLAAEMEGRIKAAIGMAPAEALERYAAPEDGWWRLDTAHRRLEAHVAQMEEEFALDMLLNHARHRYERVLDEMAGRFADSLKRGGFQFGALPHQTDVFHRYVEPLLNQNKRVAYILVDALRFEMGRELHDTLAGTVRKAVTAVVATPPTITQVGMAALMPGAEKGVALTIVGGKVGLAIEGTDVVGSGARRDWIRRKTGGGWAEDMTLDDLVSDTERKVKTRLEKKSLVVIRSQEIDAQGEEDNRHAARQTMTLMLGALRKGIARLAKLGFTHVVIAADHGYLFGEEYGADRKTDPPSGPVTELHRRCWIGHHATPPPHTLHFKAADLGLGGDLELVIPRGLAIFKAKGGAETYFHGGLSLQELVIPVVTAELSPPGKEKGGKSAELALKPMKQAVTNRLFIIEVTFASAIDPTKGIQLVAVEKDQEVGRALGAGYGFDDQKQEILLETQKPNQVFVQLSGDLEGTGTLTVQAVNPRTGLVLTQVTLPYELV